MEDCQPRGGRTIKSNCDPDLRTGNEANCLPQSITLLVTRTIRSSGCTSRKQMPFRPAVIRIMCALFGRRFVHKGWNAVKSKLRTALR